MLMTQPWQLWVLWGVFIGVGTGAMALVLGAIVANRWFHTHRGLVTGIFSAANATGQLLFLPLIARTAGMRGGARRGHRRACWRSSWPVLVLPFLRDRPVDMGRCRTACRRGRSSPPPVRRAARPGWRSGCSARPATAGSFWALVLTFWVCGWSTNGIIQTHFVPAAHDHGMPSTTAAGLLAVVGIFDIAGTVASGWLTDRVDPRWLLVAYYGGRGVSLLALDAVLRSGHRARASGCSSCSTAWTGWPPCHPPSRCAASTSESRTPAWSSAGCSRRTWWARGSAPASRGGCARARATTTGAWLCGGRHPVLPGERSRWPCRSRRSGRGGACLMVMRGGQPTRVTTPVARACRASLASLSGSEASTSCACRATASVCALARAIAGWAQAQGLVEAGVVARGRR